MIILLLLSINTMIFQSEAGDKCVSVFMPDFKKCDFKRFETVPSRPCQDDIPLCKRGFNVSFVHMEPFSHKNYSHVIEDVITHCCGSCGNMVTINNFTSMTEITSESIESSDVVYPVVGRVNTQHLYGYNFIPFWDVHDAFYITKRRSKIMEIQFLFKSIESLWPLIVSMLLMAVIAGFLVWVVETWVNKEEFPRNFLIGLFDAFWWSFISMTTVGYGDKAPKYVISRIISVLWILIGITICGLFTACLTTDITRAVSPEKPTMMSKDVGVLKERIYDISLVSKLGGIAEESQSLDLLTAVTEFIDKVENESLSGFLLDRYSFRHAISSFNRFPGYTKYWDFLSEWALVTKKEYHGDKLSYGVLLREAEDHEFFNTFVGDNRLGIETCDNIAFNRFHRYYDTNRLEENHDIFSPESGLFELAMIVICCMIGIITVFGIIYETIRRLRKRSKSAAKQSSRGNKTTNMGVENGVTVT